MDTVQLLGSTLGLGFAAGMRLYATILALGLGIRFGWIDVPASFGDLRVLGEPMVLIPAGIACLVEFVSDKVPWLDSLWDSFHTFIRPIGASVLAATAFGSVDPTLKWLLVVLCGGVALSSHSSKAATRVMVNHSPEPFSNIGLSLAGDLFVPFCVWVAVEHPMVAITFVAIFAVIFIWLVPKIYRLLSRSIRALREWLGGSTKGVAPKPLAHR
ncbi:MAG TPA: DUF4126 domain-containing protein [Bryobacteraceae bacterium]|nr:DUF4126 domain-containing protein [Bryobacteraceae bacterium]